MRWEIENGQESLARKVLTKFFILNHQSLARSTLGYCSCCPESLEYIGYCYYILEISVFEYINEVSKSENWYI
jgi:hypothetical protein